MLVLILTEEGELPQTSGLLRKTIIKNTFILQLFMKPKSDGI
jgi:hypothetical protein